eukprot:11808068-Alexandrium_andersonii.AAC.1
MLGNNPSTAEGSTTPKRARPKPAAGSASGGSSRSPKAITLSDDPEINQALAAKTAKEKERKSELENMRNQLSDVDI